MLCDFVQAADNKLFVNGGSVNRSWVQPEPPHRVKLGLATVVHVPYTATNQPHKLTITLKTEDGKPVVPHVPDGMPEPGPVEVAVTFNVGRPPILTPGETQDWSFAVNFELDLPQLGGYNFLISIDGSEAKRLPLRVAVLPPGMNLIQPQAAAS